MKKILLIISVVLITICTYAQPPGEGRGPGGPPPGNGMGHRPSSTNDNKLILEHFPEIPNLTLEQREKVGSILTSERKDTDKQMEKKREIEIKRNPDMSNKDLEKQHKEINKIDKKIQDIRGKSDKKIRKVLSDEQYLVFAEKRDEFKFKRHRQRPSFGEQRPGNDESRPPLPDENENFD